MMQKLSDITFGEFFNNRGLIKGSCAPSRLDEFNKILDYLQYIQTSQGVSFDEMPLSALSSHLFVQDGKIYVENHGLDKRKVNADVEIYLAPARQQETVVITELTDEIKAKVAASFAATAEKMKQELIAKEPGLIAQVEIGVKHSEQAWRQILENRNRVESITAAPSGGLLQKLQELMQDNFWRFESFDNNIMEFVTAAPITLIHRNTAAGIDMSVTFGKFTASFNLVTGQIFVKPLSGNNLSHRGYFHPHINKEGSMCFGNGKDTISRALVTKDIVSIYGVIKSILTTYNSDNPYISLATFKDEQAAHIKKLEAACPGDRTVLSEEEATQEEEENNEAAEEVNDEQEEDEEDDETL